MHPFHNGRRKVQKTLGTLAENLESLFVGGLRVSVPRKYENQVVKNTILTQFDNEKIDQ